MSVMSARSVAAIAAVLVVLSPGDSMGQPSPRAADVIDQGSWPSGVVDGDSWPHLCYRTPDNTLRYGYKDQDGWHTEYLDAAFPVPPDVTALGSPSLATDGAGVHHVAYAGFDGTPLGSWLGYGVEDSTGWEIGHFFQQQLVGATQLAVESSGIPHVAYQEMLGGMPFIRHAYKTASSWVHESVPGAVGPFASISIDATGFPSIAWADFFTDNHMRCSVKGSGGWSTFVVDDSTPAEGAAIAVDGLGNQHIAYVTAPAHHLWYAVRTGADSWSREVIDSTSIVHDLCSLRLDTDGNPHVGYYDTGNGDLCYAFKSPLGWSRAVVDSTGDVGEYVSLALDGDDAPHFFYNDNTNGTVRYLHPFLVLHVTRTVSGLDLTWSPARGADGFWVYGAFGQPFFPPGLVPPYAHRLETLDGSAVAWSTTAAPGDPDSNWTYLIIAVDAAGQELARSNRAGEFDYAASIP